jgi:hypothetical protein
MKLDVKLKTEKLLANVTLDLNGILVIVVNALKNQIAFLTQFV